MALENLKPWDADEALNMIGTFFKNFSNINWNEAYDQGGDITSWNAKLHGDGAPQFKNLDTNTFQTNSAESHGLLYDSVNDLYKTPDLSGYYLVIEASSWTENWTNGTNDTYIFPLSSGVWLVCCDTGTSEVQRAQVIKSLFYGTDGSDPEVTEFTSITAIKSPDSRDVGRRVHYVEFETVAWNTCNATYTGTFVNTTDNTDVSSWSNRQYLNGTHATSEGWYIPASTAKNIGGATDNDETGTDTSGDEQTNPADCKCRVYMDVGGGDGTLGGSNNHSNVKAIIVCKGDITWAASYTNASHSGDVTNNTDFYSDASIPDFTSATLSDVEESFLLIKTTASSTVTNSISSFNSEVDATSTIALEVSYNGGSNYTSGTESEIVRANPTGTELWRKIIITRTDLTKIDKITEEAIWYNLY